MLMYLKVTVIIKPVDRNILNNEFCSQQQANGNYRHCRAIIYTIRNNDNELECPNLTSDELSHD